MFGNSSLAALQFASRPMGEGRADDAEPRRGRFALCAYHSLDHSFSRRPIHRINLALSRSGRSAAAAAAHNFAIDELSQRLMRRMMRRCGDEDRIDRTEQRYCNGVEADLEGAQGSEEGSFHLLQHQ